ncbi:DUF3990 domain-containing protein [Anaerocolumna aminovalerica]|uniref:DUF3990 domain-containing protein n=1 Tax=Anaerocolumna aminovalerica TaxID=1527 RepID=UPI001C0EF52C|nr:DUF3990 domain-containing protein [Anaerocolumna aminovalerica]MBU5332119.1 DUF3990 domain-containing protein [Anaerocolumna aminovalerica]
MLVYHGTIKQSADNIVKNGILLSKSKEKLDFGKGFYTTPDVNFAISTAFGKNIKAKEQRYEERFKGAILEFEFDENLGSDDLKKLLFKSTDIEWAQFIINNRNGHPYIDIIRDSFHNINATYDIIVGSIADGVIVSLTEQLNILGDKITEDELKDIIYNYNTLQVSFHTQKSLDCIRFIRCGIINSKKGVDWYE